MFGISYKDWFLLSKPNLVLMVVFTALVSYFLVSGQFVFGDVGLLFSGTFFSAVGSHILNQYLERDSDGLMQRTKDRPLPTNRIKPKKALWIGIACLFLGVALLLLLGVIPAFLSALTAFFYVGIYTPMKKISVWNTWIGAFPGAFPIFIGFYAAQPQNLFPPQTIWVTFLLLYLWQIPHFLSLAWKYKEDYKNAGLKMLVLLGTNGILTGWVMIFHGLALFAIVVYAYFLHQSLFALLFSVLMTIIFFSLMLGFLFFSKKKYASRIFLFSLFYLPLVFLAFILPNWINSF